MILLSGNGGNETSFSILIQIVQQIQDKEEQSWRKSFTLLVLM